MIFGDIQVPSYLFEAFIILCTACLVLFITHMLLVRIDKHSKCAQMCLSCTKIRLNNKWIDFTEFAFVQNMVERSKNCCPECADRMQAIEHMRHNLRNKVYDSQ